MDAIVKNLSILLGGVLCGGGLMTLAIVLISLN